MNQFFAACFFLVFLAFVVVGGASCFCAVFAAVHWILLKIRMWRKKHVDG